MGNVDFKNKFNYDNMINYSREVLFAGDIVKAINEIKFDKDIWKVRWNGFVFSIKPFLCSALSFISLEDFGNILCNFTLDAKDNFYDSLCEFKKQDFDNIFTEEENYIAGSILYQNHSQVPCVARYLIGLNDVKVVRRLMTYMMNDFVNTTSRKEQYIRFKDKTICNTEAFSYFLSLYWVMQKSKRLQLLLSKEVKVRGIVDLLSDFCPSCSEHYRYLSGGITAKELYNSYAKGYDGSLPLVCKELYNLFELDFEYTVDSGLCLYYFFLNAPFCCRYEDFVLTMGCSYISMGKYKDSKSILDDKNAKIDELTNVNSELRKENRALKSSIKSLSKDVDDLNEKLESMSDDKILQYQKTIEDLNNLVSSLRVQISDLRVGLSEKDKVILEKNQVIRGQIKDIKSLKARVDCLSEGIVAVTAEEPQDFGNTTNTDDIDSMVAYLKEKKLGVFGGYEAGSLVDKFKDYGISVKHYVDENNFVVGDLDCAIVLTSDISHKTVNKLKSQYAGKFVYFGGTCVELIIKEVYDVLSRE